MDESLGGCGAVVNYTRKHKPGWTKGREKETILSDTMVHALSDSLLIPQGASVILSMKLHKNLRDVNLHRKPSSKAFSGHYLSFCLSRGHLSLRHFMIVFSCLSCSFFRLRLVGTVID